jgi:hypothetical protein
MPLARIAKVLEEGGGGEGSTQHVPRRTESTSDMAVAPLTESVVRLRPAR